MTTMKLRGMLKDDYQSRVEQAYMRKEDVITLKQVPCEMKFQATGGWIEHESEKHHYLPVFHLAGHITGIKGNFPYNVSSLDFGEDKNGNLDKDILYYMTPDEMTHLIQTGKFYTEHFELPEMLTANEYELPVLVDLTIVPPPHPAAYEQASYDVMMENAAGEAIDRSNLPLFYVSFAGTGIDRKKDKLLDYYGIDLDMDYPLYTMTAEASGYTSPTLIEYVTAPVMETEAEKAAQAELYMTEEEEARLLRQHEEEQQAQQQVESQYHPEEDYQMTQADMMLTQADRNVEARVAKRLENMKQAEQVANVREMQSQTQQNMQQVLVKEEPVVQKQEPVALQTLESFMKKPVKEELVEETPITDVPNLAQGSSHSQSELQEEPVHETVVQPEAPESYKHIEAQVKGESDAVKRNDEHQQFEDGKQDEATFDADEDDMQKLSEAQGGDVADATLQAKVNEADVRENARQVAVGLQQELHTDQEKKHREVNGVLQDIADRADVQMQGREGTELGE